jgi:hypothetical protein
MAHTRTRPAEKSTPATGALAEPPVVEPIVEQLAEGDTTQEVERPTVEFINDREWLYGQVQHRIGCPMIDASFEGTDEQPGRSHRMEHHDATEPRSVENPMPRTYRIIRCVDCGAGARIKLPRDD